MSAEHTIAATLARLIVGVELRREGDPVVMTRLHRDLAEVIAADLQAGEPASDEKEVKP